MRIIRPLLLERRRLALENLALRQQIDVLLRDVKRPKLDERDRVFWAVLSSIWSGWRDALLIVKPETVIHWHRAMVRRLWGRKTHRKTPGRPPIRRGTLELIHRMVVESPTWGAPRIHSELEHLGIEISESTVSKYIRRLRPGPGSQGWKTFLANHAADIAACDFFVVPSMFFQRLFVMVILSHDRRRIIHVGVTKRPTSRWAANQLDAIPASVRPRFLIHDRDTAFRWKFERRLEELGIRNVVTAPRSPWQNGICERVIGTLRRELTNHVIPTSERHLQRLLDEYAAYYNEWRPHMALDRDSPDGRPIDDVRQGDDIVAHSVLGGLHHVYRRAA